MENKTKELFCINCGFTTIHYEFAGGWSSRWVCRICNQSACDIKQGVIDETI